MKYCTKCGQKMEHDADYCHQCGNGIQATDVTKHNDKSDTKPLVKKRKRRWLMAGIALAMCFILAVVFVLDPVWLKNIRADLSLPVNKTTEKSMPQPSQDPLSIPQFGHDEYAVIGGFEDLTFNEQGVYSADVSEDNYTAELGPVSIDFHEWNLESATQVVVRDYEEKGNTDGTVMLHLYDISLESGQHEFISSVLVTIPCTVTEDEEGTIMLFNSETNEWEYAGFTMSEDNKFYQVDMPHFSVVSEVKVNKYVGVENDIKSTSGDMTTKGSLYQYLTVFGQDGESIPLVERSVYMSDVNFRKLFNSIDVEELKTLLMQANLPSNDSVAFALGTLNNAHSLTDCFLLFNQVEEALSASGKIRLSGAMATFGGLLTVGRIIYQANKGGSLSKIFYENRFNIAEGILGGLAYGAAYVGAMTASLYFSAAAAIVFGWSILDEAYEILTEPSSMAEVGYRLYLDLKRPKFSIATLQVGTKGDFELGLRGHNMGKALKYIYDAYTDEPQKLDAAVAQFFDDYAYLYWNSMTPEERSDFYYKSFLSSPFFRPVWEEPSQERIDEAAAKVKAVAVSECEPILRAFAVDAFNKMQSDLYKTVKLEIEPYLNQKITFTVKDKNLPEGQSFDMSQYALNDITFSDRLSPQFVPRFISSSAYSDAVYALKSRDDSDIVFECTMYHYIQMGCPTKVTFSGDLDKGVMPVSVEFLIEENQAVIEIPVQKFKINILPSDNLSATVDQLLSVSAVPEKSNYSLEGYTLVWTCEGSDKMIPLYDKLDVTYMNEGTYTIHIAAVNTDGDVVGEGSAQVAVSEVIDVIGNETQTELGNGVIGASDLVAGRAGTLYGKYESGLSLNYAISGGAVKAADDQGYSGRLYLTGTIKAGETISIQVNGTATNFNTASVVESESPLQCAIYIDGSEVKREITSVKPGGSGAVSVSFVVPSDAHEVSINCSTSTQWLGNYGSSATDFLTASFICDVVE